MRCASGPRDREFGERACDAEVAAMGRRPQEKSTPTKAAFTWAEKLRPGAAGQEKRWWENTTGRETGGGPRSQLRVVATSTPAARATGRKLGAMHVPHTRMYHSREALAKLYFSRALPGHDAGFFISVIRGRGGWMMAVTHYVTPALDIATLY